MAFVDFTNPAACEWYQSKLKALIDLGVDTFKVCLLSRTHPSVRPDVLLF